MEAGPDPTQAEPVPLGSTGRLVAIPLTNVAGDHALLVRQGDASRALLTGEHQAERDRIVLVPLDDDVELRMDGDALAVWLATGSVARAGVAREPSVPVWANAVGYVLILVVLGFTVLGSLTFFGWLVRTLT